MEVGKMITSTSNQRIKELSQIQKKSKVRSREGVFVAEGIRMVRETPYERLVSLYFSESFEKKYGNEVLDAISGGDLKIREQIRRKTEILSDAVFSYVSDTKTPQGVLAVVRQMEYTLEQMTDGVIPHLMILDNLQDPGNLGTIIRIADWFGIEHIFCSPDTADLYNPKTVQATMGAMARVCVHYLSLTDLLRTANADIPVYGTFLDGNDMYGTELSPNGLIVMGNEGKGISRDVASLINRKLYIPNYPPERNTSESLNVAVATAIVCAEFRRRDTIG